VLWVVIIRKRERMVTVQPPMIGMTSLFGPSNRNHDKNRGLDDFALRKARSGISSKAASLETKL
jgi:hypothetical protein